MLLLKILIILLLIFFPFAEILRFNLGNNIFLKPLDAISVIIFLWTFFLYVKNKKFRTKLQWYYFIFPVTGFISLLINLSWLTPHDFLTSFLYGLRWISYVGLFFAILQIDESFRKKIITFLTIDGIVILLIGYIQFFMYPSLRNLYYLGWDEHLYRMFSSFLDPNFAGAFFVLYLFFIAGLLFAGFKTYSKKRIVFTILLLIATLGAVLLTYSRSALLMLIVSGIVFFILIQKRKFILYLLGLILVFIIILSPYFYIENLNLFRMASTIARFQTTEHVLQIIQANPILGVGFDSYRYAQLKYHFISPNPQIQAHSASGDDTSLLFVLATTGIIGLVSYCYLWFRLFKDAANIYKKNTFALIFIASAAGLFINAIFNNTLFYSEIMFWMWVITGLMYKNSKNH